MLGYSFFLPKLILYFSIYDVGFYCFIVFSVFKEKYGVNAKTLKPIFWNTKCISQAQFSGNTTTTMQLPLNFEATVVDVTRVRRK